MIIKIKKKIISRRGIVLATALIVVGLIIASTIFVLVDDRNDLSEEDKVTDLSEAQFKEASSFNEPSIEQYNSPDNCWIIYQSNVYDVTTILADLADVSETSCGTGLDSISQDTLNKIAPYIVTSVSN